jgi:hypothetical protein
MLRLPSRHLRERNGGESGRGTNQTGQYQTFADTHLLNSVLKRRPDPS